jgi:DegV family protein with EDD domain
MRANSGRLRPRRVAVVTDSTAYLPTGPAAAAGVTVVPLQLDGSVFGAEGVDVAPADIAAALLERGRVTTSRPAPAALSEAYAACSDAGATAVVSVHLSGSLSGTVAAARVAAEEAPLPVRVIDSRSTAMGLGFAVLAAAAAADAGADAGADVEEVAATAERVAAGTRTMFYLDTLEHLRRGGRIGAARALLGTALSVKPILHVADGLIVPLERVRTPSRGVARLAALAAAAASDGDGGSASVDIAVHHLAAPERAEKLVGLLRSGPIRIRECYVCEIGAVIGAHVGPGVVGVVVSPVESTFSGSAS